MANKLILTGEFIPYVQQQSLVAFFCLFLLWIIFGVLSYQLLIEYNEVKTYLSASMGGCPIEGPPWMYNKPLEYNITMVLSPVGGGKICQPFPCVSF